MVIETTSIVSLLRLNKHFFPLLQPLAHESIVLSDHWGSDFKYTPMNQFIWLTLRTPLHPFIKNLTIVVSEDVTVLPTFATLLLLLPVLHTLVIDSSAHDGVKLDYFWPIVRQVKTLVKLSIVVWSPADVNIAGDLPLLRSLVTESPQYIPGKRHITHLDWTISWAPLENVERSLNDCDALKSLTLRGYCDAPSPLPDFSLCTVSR